MKKGIQASLLLMLALMLATAVVSADTMRKGTIRGTVYVDADGNGVCGAGDTAVANINIRFTTTNGQNAVTLFTGQNGTYGLVSVGQGNWVVTAQPSSQWRITSTNPLSLQVSEPNTLIRTNINFCVVSTGGTAPISRQLNSGVTFSPSPIVSDDLELNYAVSSALLGTPVDPPPDEVVAEIADDLDKMDEAAADDPEPPGAPDWLVYLNQFRTMANLPLLSENETLTTGSIDHSRYMVVNDKAIAHSENVANALYTPLGSSSARNGNIFATSQVQADYKWAMNFWVSGPFHLLGILNPSLTEVGYGQHNQEIGLFRMAAVLDVRATQSRSTPEGITYPIFFPGDGGETFIVRRSLFEWPDPLTACPGYSAPMGPALVLMLGDGSRSPSVTSHQVYRNDTPVQSCMFNENTYVNPDSYAQQEGRSILNKHDSIIITPQEVLVGGATYRVEVVVNGQFYTWSFTVRQQ